MSNRPAAPPTTDRDKAETTGGDDPPEMPQGSLSSSTTSDRDGSLSGSTDSSRAKQGTSAAATPSVSASRLLDSVISFQDLMNRIQSQKEQEEKELLLAIAESEKEALQQRVAAQERELRNMRAQLAQQQNDTVFSSLSEEFPSMESEIIKAVLTGVEYSRDRAYELLLAMQYGNEVEPPPQIHPSTEKVPSENPPEIAPAAKVTWNALDNQSLHSDSKHRLHDKKSQENVRTEVVKEIPVETQEHPRRLDFSVYNKAYVDPEDVERENKREQVRSLEEARQKSPSLSNPVLETHPNATSSPTPKSQLNAQYSGKASDGSPKIQTLSDSSRSPDLSSPKAPPKRSTSTSTLSPLNLFPPVIADVTPATPKEWPDLPCPPKPTLALPHQHWADLPHPPLQPPIPLQPPKQARLPLPANPPPTFSPQLYGPPPNEPRSFYQPQPPVTSPYQARVSPPSYYWPPISPTNAQMLPPPPIPVPIPPQNPGSGPQLSPPALYTPPFTHSRIQPQINLRQFPPSLQPQPPTQYQPPFRAQPIPAVIYHNPNVCNPISPQNKPQSPVPPTPPPKFRLPQITPSPTSKPASQPQPPSGEQIGTDYTPQSPKIPFSPPSVQDKPLSQLAKMSILGAKVSPSTVLRASVVNRRRSLPVSASFSLGNLGSGNRALSASVDHSLEYMEERFIVIDYGSSTTRVGFNGHDFPSLKFWSMPNPCTSSPSDLYGTPFFRPNRENAPNYPAVWSYCLHEMARKEHVDFEHTGVVITVPPHIEVDTRDSWCIESVFEEFPISSATYLKQQLLPLWAVGTHSGLVLEMGHGNINVLTAIDEPLPDKSLHWDFGGWDLTKYLITKVSEATNKTFPETYENFMLFNSAREKFFSLSPHNPTTPACFTLPDGSPFQLGDLHTSFTETFFSTLCGYIAEIVSSCDPTQKPQLLNNIVLSGGATHLAGFPERLRTELASRLTLSSTNPINVQAQEIRGDLVWIGASSISSAAGFCKYVVRRSEFLENGSSIFRRCIY